MPRLLVVEDDLALRELLARGLREDGYDVDTARDGASALAYPGPYDAVVLDIGLPDADGRDVCQAMRARGSRAPVLFLSALDALPDRLAGFAAGGEDYLTKPFHHAELLARLRVLVRRGTEPDAGTTPAPVRLDPAGHRLVGPAGAATLTPTEYRLLAALLAEPGTVVRRRELVRAGWPDGARVGDNTLDQFLARLRRRLVEVGCPQPVATVRGVGYRFGGEP